MMSTKKLLETLKKELDERDYIIEKFKKKTYELRQVMNDWIEKDLINSNKEWPKDYLKQKEEWAEWKVRSEKEVKELNEILEMQEARHKKEITILKYEVEHWKKKVKKTSFLDKLLR